MCVIALNRVFADLLECLCDASADLIICLDEKIFPQAVVLKK